MMGRMYVVLLLIALVCAAPASAQVELGKPIKSTQKQTTPPKKSNSGTTNNSNKKNSTTKNNTNSSTSKDTQTSKPTSGYINGHEWVDLGLSVKWATCNVGANSPSDYGDYYAWGETKTKYEYTGDNSVAYGKNMGSIAGNPTYDAARVNWGSTWRLPTNDEIDELVNKCKGEWTTQGGHRGYKVTGPNGNSIFLPAAGWRHGTSLSNAGEGCYYWSATPDEGDSSIAYYLYFRSSTFYGVWNYRHYGQSVRPVSD